MESGAAIIVIRTCDAIDRIYEVKKPLANFMIEASNVARKFSIGEFKEYYREHTCNLAKCINDGVMAYVAIGNIVNCDSDKAFDTLASEECDEYAADLPDQYQYGYGIGSAIKDIMNKEFILSGDSTYELIKYAGIILYALRYIITCLNADSSVLKEAIKSRREDLKILENLKG